MSTSIPTTPTRTGTSSWARAQRMAWFGAGALAALVGFVALDSALAASSPSMAPAAVAPLAPTPSLLLPAEPLSSLASSLEPSLASSLAPAPAAQGQGNGNNGLNSTLRSLPTTSSGVSGDSNNRMIAVTGNDITGQSVLYLVDTIDKQLAVYQASGGAPGTQNVKLVGARNISLDLQLDGLNDRTEVDKQPLTFKDLERRFNNSTGNSTASGAPR